MCCFDPLPTQVCCLFFFGGEGKLFILFTFSSLSLSLSFYLFLLLHRLQFSVYLPPDRIRLNCHEKHIMVQIASTKKAMLPKSRGNCCVCYITNFPPLKSTAEWMCRECNVLVHKMCWQLLHSPNLAQLIQNSRHLPVDSPEVWKRRSRTACVRFGSIPFALPTDASLSTSQPAWPIKAFAKRPNDEASSKQFICLSPHHFLPYL